MSFKDILRRGLWPAPTPSPASEKPAVTGRENEWATAWIEALESGSLNPPQDIHDARAWDAYWTNQLKAGPMQQAFSDMMSSDDRLIPLLADRRVRTILCAGNGLSTEALSLAMHGFHVTTLDISTVAREAVAASLRNHDRALSGIVGFRMTEEAILFGDSGSLPAELCPRIHRNATHAPQAGGSLAFATGDLIAQDICPGPFDAVIERRTVQLFPEAERALAVERLACRLAERGLFVSHHHDGCGRPNQTRHYATPLVTSRGFMLDYQADVQTRVSAPRLACLRLSTG